MTTLIFLQIPQGPRCKDKTLKIPFIQARCSAAAGAATRLQTSTGWAAAALGAAGTAFGDRHLRWCNRVSGSRRGAPRRALEGRRASGPRGRGAFRGIRASGKNGYYWVVSFA